MEFLLLFCTTSPLIIMLFSFGAVAASLSGCKMNNNFVALINTIITILIIAVLVIFELFFSNNAEEKVMFLSAIPFFLIDCFLTASIYGIFKYMEKKLEKK